MKTFEGWYCAHCQRSVDASEVTFHEQHTVCGRTITDDAPPGPPGGGPVAWLAEGTRQDTGAVVRGPHYGDPDSAERYANIMRRAGLVGVSVQALYPASVKAERDALQRENAELRERVKELEADAAMLDQMQDEYWNVECEAYPIADSGDSDIEWRVFSSHMAEPRRREIGYGRTPREALNAAMQEVKP